MSKSTKMLLATATAVAALICFTASAANAATAWQKAHPRRAEVNHRLANQNRRIHEERKEGELTPAQAAALHKDDRQIRQEERDMASQNGGHITREEQRTLNQQENKVSRQIGR
jgi:Spy/CpxP family protein refolding chaperone